MSTERNIRLYPWHAFFFNALFWYPVFFLYFNSLVELEDVLLIEALYYVTVVVTEVPSGYFSDRVGRRATLLISALSFCAAYAAFFFAEGVWLLAAGQCLLALGMSFNSGTATSFHLDSLTAAGRPEEYGDREELVSKRSFQALAVAVLAGGAAGMYSLNAAYGLSFLSAVGLLVLALLFTEPPPADDEAPDFLAQIGRISRHVRQPWLGWLFGFSVVMTALIHAPYELYQPYIDMTLAEGSLNLLAEKTPLVTGIHACATMILGAWFAGRSVQWSRRFGLKKMLLLSTFLLMVIVASMGTILHPLIVLVVVARGVPKALYGAPLRNAVTPHLPQSMRASYLSVQSLAGRLGFALFLALLSWVARGGETDWASMQRMALTAAGVAVVLLVLLVFTSKLLDGGPLEG